MAKIELKNISKTWENGAKVLDDVSLTIENGEFLVLLGASGSGKSTLLRIVAGLESVTEGTILIDGVDVTWIEPKKRQIAMVFQNYALYPHLTVAENIAYPLAVAGKMTQSEKERKINDTAKILRIEDILDKKPAKISGGQRQRVAIARALVRQPRAFLFDEPLSNLDARLRDELRYEIMKFKEELGITTIHVTHDQGEAMSLADNVVLLNNGKIEQSGNPKLLYQNPSSLYVAQFIGHPEINCMDGTLINKEMHTIIGDFTYEGIDGDWKVCFRPEAINFVKEESSDNDLIFSGEIKMKEYSGSLTNYRAEVEGKLIWISSSDDSKNLGEKYFMKVSKDKFIIFKV